MPDPNLPDRSELDACWDKLADFEEELGDLARRVFSATNFQEEQEVTDEHIASLAVFARRIRKRAEAIAELAQKIETATLNDLETIRLEGSQINVPQFDEDGRANFEGKYMTTRAASRYFPKTAPNA